jgi:hypothetical protein
MAGLRGVEELSDVSIYRGRLTLPFLQLPIISGRDGIRPE